jgi:serine/threonine-protein kinase
MPEVVGQVLNNEPKRLSEMREGISLDLELVVARCLASAAKDRFQSVAELATALRSFASDPAAAATSVAKITRVLGGASIPPAEAASPASGAITAVTILAAKTPTTGGAEGAEAEGATVRPPAPTPKGDAEAKTAAEAQPEIVAVSTPRTELSGSIPAPKPSAATARSRALFALGGVALVTVVLVALRTCNRPTTTDTGPTNANVEPSATAITSIASIASAVAPPSAAPSEVPSASPSETASAPAIASTARPVARPPGTTAQTAQTATHATSTASVR